MTFTKWYLFTYQCNMHNDLLTLVNRSDVRCSHSSTTELKKASLRNMKVQHSTCFRYRISSDIALFPFVRKYCFNLCCFRWFSSFTLGDQQFNQLANKGLPFLPPNRNFVGGAISELRHLYPRAYLLQMLAPSHVPPPYRRGRKPTSPVDIVGVAEL